jgi:nucleoside-diphosphate-sugar epimerase
MNKIVVVAGANGKLGRLIIESLASKPGVAVRALVRNTKTPEAIALAKSGAQLIELDIESATAEARAEAVKGAFAVISAVQGGPNIIIDAQRSLLLAAKAAGVRRFIPSDYSYNIFSLPEGVNINSDWRRTFAQLADQERSDTFEITHVMQGIFADKYVMGFLGLFDAQQRILRYWGDGKAPIDWTTWEDTARFTAAAALDDRPVPARLFVAGERMDVLTFAATYEKTTQQSITLQPLGSLDDLQNELKKQLAQSPQNMYAWLPLMYARGVFEGQALLGELHNSRYPEIKPESVAQAIARGAI